MEKKNLSWLFAVIVLVILLAVSVALGMSGYYFSVAYLNLDSDLVVGDYVNVNVMPNQSTVKSFTFDGSYLPGENIPQLIQISAQNLNVDLKVRVKTQIFGIKEDQEIDFVTSEHFEKAEDGYYYFDNVLQGGSKITFCQYLVMPKQNKFLSNKKYILSVIFETLDVNSENIWQSV